MGLTHGLAGANPSPASLPARPPHAWESLLPRSLAEPGLAWVDALGSLTFENPVAIATPPGETNRLFVVERTGRIQVVPDLTRPESAVFLDLTENLASAYLETGVLGLAFHPDYARNRRFFVFRTTLGVRPDGAPALYNVLARFETAPDDPNRADPGSERPMIVQEDASPEHNAGDLQFGPDGYLHVSLGDMTPPWDQHDGSRQPLDGGFFGAILRLDVDERPENLPPNPHPAVRGGYRVPADNPFVGLTSYLGRTYRPGRVRTEFFALGFRNPWRMTFHPTSGELWVGDVGDGAFEEINVVRSGGNYGWPYREGHTNGIHWFLAPPGFESEPPLVSYGRGGGPQHGNAVIGGVFYHGTALPSLHGAYLYADSRSGHTWAVRRDPGGPPPVPEWLATEPGLVSFGHDPRDGEILAAHYPTGRLRKLAARSPDPSNRVPPTLADTGLFSDLATLTPAPGLRPYDIQASFWSDRAAKRRWFALPAAHPQIEVRDDGAYSFPPGTLWVKHFELDGVVGHPPSGRRLETRLLVRTESGAYGVTYRWDPAGSNAFLVPGGGIDESITTADQGATRQQVWRYPGWSECLRCHTEPAGYALGFRTEQLNLTTVTDGSEQPQLDLLRQAGLFRPGLPPADTLPALVNPADLGQPLHHRARSYLDSNCSGCHRPGHLVDTTVTWDARHTTPLHAMGLLDGRLLIPGVPAESALVHIMARSPATFVMPPLGSHLRDPLGFDLVSRWTASIPAAPWTQFDLDTPNHPGIATLDGTRATLSSRSGPWSEPLPSGHVLARPLAGDGFIEARLVRLDAPSPDARAGMVLMNPPRTGSGTPVAAAWLGNLAGTWQQLGTPHAPESHPAPPIPEFSGPVRLRLARAGSTWTASIADGQRTWETPVTLPGLDPEPLVGLSVASGCDAREVHAWFEQVSWLQARWESPPPDSTVGTQTPVPIRLRFDRDGIDVRQIDLLLNDQPFASVLGTTVSHHWTPATAGEFRIAARVTTSTGHSFTLAPRRIRVLEPDPAARLVGEDRLTQGNAWDRYGRAGHHLWNRGHSLPAFLSVIPLTGTFHAWDDHASSHPSALAMPGTAGRAAFAWYAEGPLLLDVLMPDGRPRRIALYFLDWDTDNLRSQEVTVLDASNESVLARHQVESFSGGAYLVLEARGSVRIRIEGRPTETTVLTGLFLDDAPAPATAVRLVAPGPGTTVPAPATLTLHADVIQAAEAPSVVQFVANDRSLGVATTPPYTLEWTNVLAGIYHLEARATDRLGRVAVSPSIPVTVAFPEAQAVFLGYEPAARGAWEGRLGSLGHALAAGSGEWPDAINFQPVAHPREHIWDPRTRDRRAAVPVTAVHRQAACWVGVEDLEFDFDFRDGQPAILSVYLLDWESDQRRQCIEIVDRLSGRVLHRHPARRFFGGVHFVYHVQGSIRVRVSPEFVNAAVTGFFVDPVAVPAPFLAPLRPPVPVEDGLHLAWSGTPGALYRLVTRPDWTTPWSPLPIVASSPTGAFQAFDPFPEHAVPPARFLNLERLTEPTP